MTARLATAADKIQALALMDEFSAFLHASDVPSRIGGDQYDAIMSDPNTHIFVAEDAGRLLGLGILYLTPNIRHGNRQGHIEDFFISQSSRHGGVGTAIFDAIKDFCRSHEVKVIKLNSGLELTVAHRFYKKNGGKTTERFFRFDL